MKFTGTILKLFPVEENEYNGDPTAKLDIILESKPNDNGYTDTFKVQMWKKGDHVKFLTENFKFQEGDAVKCEIGGKVNEWKEKWYGNLSIFKLELDDTVVQSAPAPMEAPVEAPPEGAEEDLPF
tara:strand:- start:149 stop:523 length:375 start_codon:yes stop_codon:yes gene_type:complete